MLKNVINKSGSLLIKKASTFKRIFIPLTVIACSAVVLYAAISAIFRIGSKAATSDEPYSIIIVAGQSNTNGEKSLAANITTPYPTLGSHSADNATKMIWSTGNNLVNTTWHNSTSGQFKTLADTQPSGWFGPELGLARSLYDGGRRNMIVVKVAYGGQLLSKNGTGLGFTNDWNVGSNNESYDKLIERINDVKTMLTNQGDTYTVDGFYWMQGESDAVLGSQHGTNYETNLTNLISNLKTDVGLHPQAKIVLGKISIKYCLDNIWNWLTKPNGCNVVAAVGSNYYTANTGNTNVRNALQNYADTHDDTSIVETEDLTRTSSGQDWVHLIWSSELILGDRMANSASLPYRLNGSNDYDGDGTLNNAEDSNSNGNLGDDDTDSDGMPNYLDAPAPPPDTTPPTGSIQIDNNAAQTQTNNVTLQLDATDDSGPTGIEMRISEDQNFSGANWQAFASSTNWTLSAGYGQKTVYYQLRDSSNNESIVYSDNIEYVQPVVPDTTPPTGSIQINSGDSQTQSNTTTLQVGASDDSGLSGSQMRISENQNFSGANWQSYNSEISWTLSAGYGQKNVYYQLKDSSGNLSEVYQDSIEYVTTDSGNNNNSNNTPSNSPSNTPSTSTNSTTSNSQLLNNYFHLSEDGQTFVQNSVDQTTNQPSSKSQPPKISKKPTSDDNQNIKSPNEGTPKPQQLEETDKVKFIAVASVSMLSAISMSLGVIMLFRFIQ